MMRTLLKLHQEQITNVFVREITLECIVKTVSLKSIILVKILDLAKLCCETICYREKIPLISIRFWTSDIKNYKHLNLNSKNG